MINDPKVSSSWFVGLQHVWRTKDNGGDQAFLEQHCNEFFGDFTEFCGDWEPLGGTVNPATLVSSRNDAGDLSGTFWGLDKGGDAPAGNYVVALSARQRIAKRSGRRRGAGAVHLEERRYRERGRRDVHTYRHCEHADPLHQRHRDRPE
jgi:hypothetical protein